MLFIAFVNYWWPEQQGEKCNSTPIMGPGFDRFVDWMKHASQPHIKKFMDSIPTSDKYYGRMILAQILRLFGNAKNMPPHCSARALYIMHEEKLVGGNDASETWSNDRLARQAAALSNSIKNWQIGLDLSEPIKTMLELYQFKSDA
jgi:hypothetical protein